MLDDHKSIETRQAFRPRAFKVSAAGAASVALGTFASRRRWITRGISPPLYRLAPLIFTGGKMVHGL
jgi:hypothetical protein